MPDRIFFSFRRVYNAKIPDRIRYSYKEFKNRQRFDSQIKNLKSLLYWINEIEKTSYMSQREHFMQELHNDAIKIVQEKAKRTKGDGNIRKDIENLKGVPYFDLVEVYKKQLEKTS